jgi:hypothetical protein
MKAARAPANRRLVAGALLFTFFTVYLLLVLFPGTPFSANARELWSALSLRPRLQAVFLVSAGTLVWAIWSLAGGALLRGTAQGLAERPAEENLVSCRRRWGALFWAPIVSVLSSAFLLVLAALLVLPVAIPWVGWLLVLVLSPAILVLGGAGARRFLRWVFAGHLILPGIAVEGSTAFAATGRAQAWLRRSPLGVVGLRLAGALLVVAETVRALSAPALALAALGWFVSLLPGDPGGRVLATVRNGIGDGTAADAVAAGAAVVLSLVVAAWYLAVPVCHRIGGRAGLYLLHRRDLDGVPLTDPGPDPGPPKSLEELGVELVERIRGEAEEE